MYPALSCIPELKQIKEKLRQTLSDVEGQSSLMAHTYHEGATFACGTEDAASATQPVISMFSSLQIVSLGIVRSIRNCFVRVPGKAGERHTACEQRQHKPMVLQAVTCWRSSSLGHRARSVAWQAASRMGAGQWRQKRQAQWPHQM